MTPDFVFYNSSGTLPRVYDVQIALASDPSFNSPVQSISSIAEGSGTTTCYTLTTSLSANTNYLWRVRCRDAAHETSNFSDAQSFTTNSTP